MSHPGIAQTVVVLEVYIWDVHYKCAVILRRNAHEGTLTLYKIKYMIFLSYESIIQK